MDSIKTEPSRDNDCAVISDAASAEMPDGTMHQGMDSLEVFPPDSNLPRAPVALPPEATSASNDEEFAAIWQMDGGDFIEDDSEESILNSPPQGVGEEVGGTVRAGSGGPLPGGGGRQQRGWRGALVGKYTGKGHMHNSNDNDSEEAMEFKLGVEVLTGKDDFSMNFIQYWRSKTS